MLSRSYFTFVCLGCNQNFQRRMDKKSQSQYCRSCRGRKTLTTHGKANSRLYKIWQGIKTRCLNNHPRYGGRGITVCDDWLSFDVFQTWALNNGYSDDLTIDRTNVNGNYEPSNCRWITLLDQSHNREKGLTWDHVNEIRKLAVDYKHEFLANKFNVSKHTIHLVVRNKIWIDPSYIPIHRHRCQKIQNPIHHP